MPSQVVGDQQGFAIKLSKNQCEHYGSQFGEEGNNEPPGIIGKFKND